ENHLAIVLHVAEVASAAMAGKHKRAAVLAVHRDDQIDERVERGDDALEASARLEIDDGIARRHEHVARRDHVGAAEEYEAVPISVRVRLMDDADPFPVEVDLLLVAEEAA